MESKGADGSRPSSKPSEGSWWRWTHGKSGSISSSSHGGGSLANSHVGGVPSSNSHSSSSSSIKSATSSPSDAVRWQKRTSRSGLSPKEETASTSSFGDTWSSTISSPAGSGASTSSPKFFSAASSSRSARPTAVGSKKKVATPLSSRYGREGLAKKAPIVAAPSSSTFVFSASARDDKHTLSSEISWSMGTTKRTVGRKNKKSGKSVSSTLYSSRGGARSAAARSARFLPDVNEDTEMRAPDASTNAFAFAPHQSQFKDYSGLPLSRYDLAEPAAPTFDFDGSFSQCPQPFAPTSPSTASTASTTSSFASQSFSKADPLVDCARAVLQDCIRQRQMEQSTARKRSADSCLQGSSQESKSYGWQYGSVSKSSEYGMMSSGASSSSDDELSQLSSSLDQSFCGEKAERGCESKLAREEVYRQILVGDYDLSSSPEYQCFSPLFEEKGLPIEIRYQLPLALGTANETNKECTICQIRYGIGDHIVTLPCQHFFHACCVDKWLWNHTSCPLCRTEVSLDQDTDMPNTKHNFTECSQVDQERIRRQMRSSSQRAGFRPVIPVELDQLEMDVLHMTVDDEDTEVEEPTYLVCPTPHLATNFQGSCSGN